MTLSDEQLDRYARHIVLRDIGGPGQARLLDSQQSTPRRVEDFTLIEARY